MFQSSKKDAGFATGCFRGRGLLKIMHRGIKVEKKLFFSRPHTASEKSWRSCHGPKQDGPLVRSGKRHFRVEKKSSLFALSTCAAVKPLQTNKRRSQMPRCFQDENCRIRQSLKALQRNYRSFKVLETRVRFKAQGGKVETMCTAACSKTPGSAVLLCES